MMHTIISLSDIFAGSDNTDIITELSDNGYREYVTVNGKRHLRRCFSTDPQDYLRLQ